MPGILKLEILGPILSGRYRFVFWVFFVITALGTVLNFWIPKQYTSTATVLLDTTTAKLGNTRSTSDVADQRFLREQVALVSSFNTALRVVEALGLEKSTEARQLRDAEEEARGSLSQGPLKGWLADSLLRKIKVRAASDSNVLDIEFTSTDPQFAAAIANAFVRAYIKTVADNQNSSSKLQIQYVQRQLADLREGMSSLEKNIHDLQQQEEYFAIGDRFEIESKRLQALQTRIVNSVKASEAELVQLRAEYEAQKVKVANIDALRAKLKAMQSNLDVMQRSREFAMQRIWQDSFSNQPDAFSVINLRAAEIPDSPTLPKLWINLPLCALIGLILGVVVALVVELIDRRIRTEADVREVLGLPVLATVAL